MAADLVNYPAGIAAAIQSGFLEAEFRSGLDSRLAYAYQTTKEPISAATGQTLTITRHGRKAPADTPKTAASMNSNTDNGITQSNFSVEQFTLELLQYADSAKVNILQEQAGVKKQSLVTAKNNGVQAMQTKERVARKALFNAYLSGNTRVRTGLGSSTTTVCYVDDIRGFGIKLVNGVPTAVSASNKLSVVEYSATTGAAIQTLLVSGVTAEGTNYSSAPDGISGYLTFDTATAPLDGSQLVAANAPKIFRPNGRLHTAQLTGADIFSLSLVLDAVAYLRDNGIPENEESGLYHCVLSNTSMRQLFEDPSFKLALQGQINSPEYKKGQIIELLGVRFMPTTETYVQAAGSGVGVQVNRPIIMGAECLIEGEWKGMDQWLADLPGSSFHEINMHEGIAHIVRPPIDLLAQNCDFSWFWTGAMACGTDLTASTSVIPTANGPALYKRAAVIEHA